jgi:methylthioribose-1-phosphate isomerase
MLLQTIAWKNNAIRIIDQTLLPEKLVYLNISSLKSLWQAIKLLKVRGAPALGAAAALGVYLGVKDLRAVDFRDFSKGFEKAAGYIGSSRPTARNLFWGIERMRGVVFRNKHKPVTGIKKLLFQEALKIIEEDKDICRKIGSWGATLIKNRSTVLTICNAGILATIDYGTALGVFYRAAEEGKLLKVYACETRPLLQGARLTAWELKKMGMDVTVIPDGAAATLMRQATIDAVVAGADRIAANGDSANKIGTMGLAIVSRQHKVPFYIAAPSSTFDLGITRGSQITIEKRDPREVIRILLKKSVAPKGAKVYNPAFDVTPHELITAIITEEGVIRPPYLVNIRRVLKVKSISKK